MKRYLFGIMLAGLISMTLAERFTQTAWWQSPLEAGDWARFVGIVLVLPVLAAWATLELTMCLRPRRHLVGRRRASLMIITLGLIAGLLAITITAIITALMPIIPDAITHAISTAATCLGSILLLPRLRPGHCVYCTYDLRGQTPTSTGRCAECGRVGDARLLTPSPVMPKGRKLTA